MLGQTARMKPVDVSRRPWGPGTGHRNFAAPRSSVPSRPENTSLLIGDIAVIN